MQEEKEYYRFRLCYGCVHILMGENIGVSDLA